jgi:hypothetical protein
MITLRRYLNSTDGQSTAVLFGSLAVLAVFANLGWLS